MSNWIPYDEYVAIYSRVPRLTVEILSQTKDGVLLVERATQPGIGNWHLPGGAILFNESIEEALVRIADRELGQKITIQELVGINQWVNTESVLGHDVSLVYRCQLEDDQITLDDGGRSWKRFETLPEPTFPEYKKFFADSPNFLKIAK